MSKVNRKFDERKSYNSSGVRRIFVNIPGISYVNVVVNTSDTNNIDVHFHGKVTIEGTFKLECSIEDSSLNITLKSKGYCHHYTFLNITITVPKDKIFNYIEIKSKSNISIEDLSVKQLRLHSKYGMIQCSANFIVSEMLTENGNIELNIDAKQSFNAELTAILGNIDIKLKNIGCLHLCGHSAKILNSFQKTSGFVADIFYSITSGIIEVSNF